MTDGRKVDMEAFYPRRAAVMDDFYPIESATTAMYDLRQHMLAAPPELRAHVNGLLSRQIDGLQAKKAIFSLAELFTSLVAEIERRSPTW